MSKTNRLMLKIALLLLIGYALLSLVVYIFQDRFIFQKVPLNKNHVFSFGQNYTEHLIEMPDRTCLNALHFKTADSCKGIVIYFHGNADNLQRWGHFAADFTRLGYDVLMIDYRGYGKSTGKPTEQNLYSDAENVWNWAKSNYKYDRWVIYGRSLGAAVATNLAQKVQPDLLGLETPFHTINSAKFAAFMPFKFRYTFPNYQHLVGIRCRKIIFHGTQDWVVPLSSAMRLKPLLSDADTFTVIPSGGHKNLNTFELYHQQLKAFLR